MANVKEIVVFGKLPFNCNDHFEMKAILGDLNAPSIGLRINYGKQSKGPKNEHGGNTTFYEFSIEGQEAVAGAYIDRMLQAIVDCGGVIDGASVVDIENSEKLAVAIPKARKGVFFLSVEATCGAKMDADIAARLIEDHYKEVLMHGVLGGNKPPRTIMPLNIDTTKTRVTPA